MAENFAEYQAEVQPLHLSGPWAEAWGNSLGIVKEFVAAGFYLAVKAHFVTDCPEDALVWIGAERDLERVPGETSAVYRERLRTSWDAYPWTGTDRAIADNLALLGVDAAIVRDRGKAWIRDASLENGGYFVPLGATAFTSDDSPPGVRWGRMWIIITNPPWTRIENYTDLAAAYATYDDWSDAGTGFGLSATLEEIERIRRFAKKWRGSHARIVEIVLISRGKLWGFPLAADYTAIPADTYNSYIVRWEGY